MSDLWWKIIFEFRTLRGDIKKLGILSAAHILYVRNIKSNGFLCSIIGHRWNQDGHFSKRYCCNCMQHPSNVDRS